AISAWWPYRRSVRQLPAAAPRFENWSLAGFSGGSRDPSAAPWPLIMSSSVGPPPSMPIRVLSARSSRRERLRVTGAEPTGAVGVADATDRNRCIAVARRHALQGSNGSRLTGQVGDLAANLLPPALVVAGQLTPSP